MLRSFLFLTPFLGGSVLCAINTVVGSFFGKAKFGSFYSPENQHFEKTSPENRHFEQISKSTMQKVKNPYFSENGLVQVDKINITLTNRKIN